MEIEKFKDRAVKYLEKEMIGNEHEGDKTIKSIYLGNMNPAEWFALDKNYDTELEEFTEDSKDILQYIPEELHEKFDQLCLKRSKIALIEEENAFVQGFRLGSRLMLETILDHNKNEENKE